MKRNTVNNATPWFRGVNTASKPEISVNKTLKPVAREDANLEVESGEQIVADMDQSGLPAMFRAGGKRHYDGGTPINLPANSFIFSRDKSMVIKDDAILAQFNMAAKRKGYTPADIAKKYDINHYRGILADKDSDDLQRNTAEMMIANYNEKLAKLALAQESLKGFSGGIPAIAMPYLQTSGLDMSQLFNQQESDTEDQGQPTARYGGGLPQFKKGGEPKKETLRRVKITPPVGTFAKGGSPVEDKIESKYEQLRSKTEEDLKKAFPGREIKVIYKEGTRSLKDQEAAYTKGSSTTKFGLHGIGAARDFNIYVNGRLLGNKGADKKIYQDYLWKNAEEQGLHHLNKDEFGAVDPYHIGLVKETGDGTAFKKLLDEYPEIQNTHQYRDMLNQIQKLKDKNPKDTTYDAFLSANDNPPKKKVVFDTENGRRSLKTVEDKPKPNLKEITPEEVKQEKANKDKVEWYVDNNGHRKLRLKNPATKSNEEFPKEAPSKTVQTTAPKSTKNLSVVDPAAMGTMDAAYNDLETSLLGNEGLRNAMYTQYKKQNPESKLRKDEVIDNFLNAQRHIFKLNALHSSDKGLDQLDWNRGDNSRYNNEMKALGETPLTKDEVKDFQHTYRGLADLSKDPQYADFFNKFAFTPVGYNKGHVYNGYNISKPDGVVGTATNQQGLFPVHPAVADVVTKNDTKETSDKKTADVPVNHVNGYNEEAPADFWLQDIIKTAGAAGDMFRIKKYLPWQGTYSPYLPQATYYDPTRELAENSEIANISSQAAGAFGSPQQLSARLSGIQGQAAQSAANILGRYNDLNVGVGNQNEAERTNILNQAGMYKADQATNLYDKTTIANQQFDNSKAMARQQLRQSFLDALTNRAETQALNTIQKQYRVNPLTGGTKSFVKPGADFADEVYKNQLFNFVGGLSGSGKAGADEIDKLVNERGWDRKDAISYLKATKGE